MQRCERCETEFYSETEYRDHLNQHKFGDLLNKQLEAVDGQVKGLETLVHTLQWLDLDLKILSIIGLMDKRKDADKAIGKYFELMKTYTETLNKMVKNEL